MCRPAIKTRMSELEQQKAEIEARLAEAPADVPDMHPMSRMRRRACSSIAPSRSCRNTRIIAVLVVDLSSTQIRNRPGPAVAPTPDRTGS